ncbi:MAG: AbrB/MazE/SpoVT family DNA-binding domain-containing protein [Clostridia bacterium]|nr:AbrB/MazE/SpoVT family DNA-binding domain-containing protein [Clostridia bacterium]
MKSTGIVRNIDELGRIVVPKEIRQRMGIANNDPVEIYIEGDKVILTKYTPVCHFCGSDSEVCDFKGKKICKSCISDIINSTK